jgi:hypothetical protein
MENMRRESISQIEQTHIRLRQEMSDTNNQLIQRTTDKLDRLRDELEYKTKENEKVKKTFFRSRFYRCSKKIFEKSKYLKTIQTESST